MSIELAYRVEGAGPPIVILHGLLGSARNWGSIAKRLAPSRRVFSVDLRNHGGSPWAARMTYDEMAQDLERFVTEHDLAPVTLLGHSMGGKVAMRLALTRGALIGALVVADIAPVAYAHAHAFQDYVAALQAVDLADVGQRGEVDRRLQAAVPDAAVRAFLLQNLQRDAEGRFTWRVNLKVLAMDMGHITAFPAGGEPFRGPALFLAGERSDYVRRAHRPLIEGLFPAAELVTVEQAGHWIHAENPEEFIAQTVRFLDRSAH